MDWGDLCDLVFSIEPSCTAMLHLSFTKSIALSVPVGTFPFQQGARQLGRWCGFFFDALVYMYTNVSSHVMAQWTYSYQA